MILTTHALVGAAVGKYVHNPVALTAILIPLHYTMDIFRHGEYLNKKSTFKNTAWKVFVDLLFPLLIILSLAHFKNFNQAILISMLTGAFVSMFPDLLTVLYWKLNFKFLKKAYLLNKFVHSRFPDDSPERAWTLRNAFNDIAFSVLAILFLFL